MSSPPVEDGRASKLRRTEATEGKKNVVTKTHNDLGPPFTDDYFPYTKGQIERVYAHRRYDDGKRAWNQYYQSNTVNGYKDRHYILREFVELNDALVNAKKAFEKEAETDEQRKSGSMTHGVRWMEIGCGVGNAVVPAMKDYPMLSVCGFDISSVAIGLFNKKAEEEGLAQRLNICVTNLAETDVPADFLQRGPQSTCPTSITNTDDGKVDFASIIFVLSAIPSARFKIFLQRSRALMKKGAVLFFRDYYENDMAQKRFSKDNQIDDTTFFRVDGTLSHFFTKEEITSLFCRENGFEMIEDKVVEREVENRKDQNTMHRRWYQARFRCV